MATCPNGHDSTWDDYCSSCGVALATSQSPAAQRDVPPVLGTSPPKPTAPDAANPDGCPNCGEPRGAGDVFCESCGFDYVSGSLPSPDPAPTPVPSAPPAAIAADSDTLAVVSADRSYFASSSAADQLTFPTDEPPPTPVPLRGGDTLIGRRSESRGVYPDIDVTDLTGDPAVSTRHAIIHCGTDRTWTVTDLDSTNGTRLGDDVTAIAAHQPVPVEPGIPIRVGAWTTIVISPAPE